MLDAFVLRARRRRWLALVVVNLRILLGFAFVPAGLKKLLGEPFTDPALTGRFHDFLDAFHATGGFYRWVGVMQLTAALLLCSQRFATLGAALALPILTAIGAFCWSTAVYPTATVVTLMWLGTLGLLAWDLPRWRPLVASEDRAATVAGPLDAPPVDLGLWRWCGLAVVALYLGVCALSGGVYRPRGAQPDSPAFYVMPAIMLLPVITLVIDRARHRRRRAARAAVSA